MRAAEKKHIQVRNCILRGVREGRYRAGQKIPTKEEIMRHPGFSRTPIPHGPEPWTRLIEARRLPAGRLR